ncbi:unnamed protein product, partial [Musa textilis]
CTFDALIDWVTGPRPACLILNRSINHPVQFGSLELALSRSGWITVARTPPKETAGAFKQTIAAAAESVFKVAGSFAEGHNKTVTTAAADSVFQSADSALSWIVSASSEILEEAKVRTASCMQHHNPALSCGIAVGMGLVPFKSKCRSTSI